MKVYIVGARGNMASRYTAILKHLGHEVFGIDDPNLGGTYELDIQACQEARSADAVIIATPTDTHARVLHLLRDCGKPILCEKPVVKDLGKLRELIDHLKAAGTRVEMVSQYDHLIFPREGNGLTSYNYWKSGGDGLAWDCINIIYHANGPIELSNDSPIWKCQINGRELSIASMDAAYVEMIDRWLKDPRDDLNRIWIAHEKVKALEAKLGL